MAKYERILERHRTYEYSPEVKERLARNREQFEKRVAEIRARRAAEVEHASDHAGQESFSIRNTPGGLPFK